MHNAARPAKLRRSLKTFPVTLYGLGVTVGAGIYVLVGATVASAGIYAPFSFLLAAVVVAFTALAYSELSTRYPLSAGEAAYVERAFGVNWLAVAVGLAVATSGIVSASAVAIGASAYIAQLASVSDIKLTLFVVAAMGLIAIWGISQSVFVAAIVTGVEILGLLIVCGWSFFFADPEGAAISDVLSPNEAGHWYGIGSATLLAFFAFIGFEDIANVAEEVEDPIRTMPRAILWTLVLATVLYLLTTTAVIHVVPTETLSGSTSPLSLVFAGAPERYLDAFSLVAIVATLNGVLIQIIMASRVLYGLADRGQLPRFVGGVWTRTQTPVAAIIIVVALIMFFSTALPLEQLAERTSQVVLLVFFLVNIALIRLKRTQPDTGQFFRVPPWIPFLGACFSAILFITGMA